MYLIFQLIIVNSMEKNTLRYQGAKQWNAPCNEFKNNSPKEFFKKSFKLGHKQYVVNVVYV